jgi:hypothetical protein
MGVGSDETHRYIQKHLCITMSMGDRVFVAVFLGLIIDCMMFPLWCAFEPPKETT